ncbi:MAG TPA: serine hydrolase domain-containing protein [Candidatus Acidoferrales bacterium]|nr:serine hydrolase domain-containing protein [Candidatus Acidoferrales bacterium]
MPRFYSPQSAKDLTMPLRRWIFGSLCSGIIACLLAAGCAAPPSQPAVAEPKTIEDLQKSIQAILTREHVPAAGVAMVAKDHVIWAGGIGKADISVDRNATADTMFRVGSISKSFVALALLHLVEQGKLDLNSRLHDVAPEIPFRNPWEASDPVRVADVLEHTAGFDDMHPAGAYNISDPPDIPLLTVLQRASNSLVSRWPPAERMAYSNEDYGIAGYLIEKITGEPYDKYVHDTVLAPLGMSQSGFQLTDAIRGRLAQGYEGDPPRAVAYHNIYLSPAGDLKSSPAEMARLVQMFLNRGKIGDAQLLEPETITRMETPQTTLAARNGLAAGYGIANYSEFVAGFESHGHDGGIDGFISTYRYFPELGIGDVVFLNSSSSGAALEEIDVLLVKYMTQGVAKPQPPAAQLSASQLSNFVGYYECLNPRDQLFAFLDRLLNGRRIILENGSLHVMSLFGRPEQLIPVTANQFRVKDAPAADRIFARDGSGNQVYITEGFYGRRMSSLWPITRLGLLALAFLLMGSACAFALVWIPRKLFRRMSDVPLLSIRWMPLAAMAALAGAFAAINAAPGWLSGAPNIYTISFCVLTWLFAALSLVSLILCLLALRNGEIKPIVRVHSLLVALACCGIASWLGWFGFIGLRMWNY